MDIVRSGAIMGVYLFVLIVIYIVLSSPFDDIMSSFEDVNMTNSDAEVEHGTNLGRLTFDIVFAAFGLIPLVWFMIQVFAREPDWRYRG